MRRWIAMFAGVFAAGQVLVADEVESVIRFSNGDRMPGTLESLSPEVLVWKSPILDKPTPFLRPQVLDLSLVPEPHELNADHEATVTLMNGDTVRGQIASVTDEIVTLDTWYAGRMNLNRLMVSKVAIDGVSSYIYQGPNGMDGWIQSEEAEPAWSYARSAFRSDGAGGIAREDALPDECSVRFDVAWKGDSLDLTTILFSNDAHSAEPESGYELSMKRGGIYLRNSKTRQHIGSVRSQVLQEDVQATIEVKASRKTGRVCLYVNGEILDIWSDMDLGRGEFGKCLHFVSVSKQAVRISKIRIAEWDGVVHDTPKPRMGLARGIRFGVRELTAPKPVETSEGRMELANGDSIEGKVISIKDGRIEMETPLGEIKIPVARFRTLALIPVDLEEPIRRQGDVRARFGDGSSIVFRLNEVRDGTLIGDSQTFGTAAFRIGAFSQIEFNIYKRKFDGKRRGEIW